MSQPAQSTVLEPPVKAVKRYGATHYIDRIMSALDPELREDFRFILGGSDASRDAKVSAFLLVQVLEELRRLNSALLVSESKVVDDPILTELKAIRTALEGSKGESIQTSKK